MMIGMRIALTLALPAVLLAGCGGGDSSKPGGSAADRAAVEATFKDYLGNLADTDGAGACAAMAPSLQRQMLAVMKQEGAGAVVNGKTCGQVLDFVAGQSAAYQRVASSLRKATITDIVIDGDRARYHWKITVGGKTVASRGEATRTAGRWLISCCVPGQ